MSRIFAILQDRDTFIDASDVSGANTMDLCSSNAASVRKVQAGPVTLVIIVFMIFFTSRCFRRGIERSQGRAMPRPLPVGVKKTRDGPSFLESALSSYRRHRGCAFGANRGKPEWFFAARR